MSQESQKPIQVELKEEDRKLLRSTIDAISKTQTHQESGRSQKSDESTEKEIPTGDFIVKHLKACPECYEKALKLVGLPVDMECGKCGARLSTRQNLNVCPFCGETKRASRI